MKQNIEVIDGQRFLVTRDDNNREIARAGADNTMAPSTDPIRANARLLLSKPARNWTPDDDRAALLFLLRKFCD